MNAKLQQIEALREALGWFLGEDARFQPMVGGNPIAVDRMLSDARLRHETYGRQRITPAKDGRG